jgi:hypothetical protein
VKECITAMKSMHSPASNLQRSPHHWLISAAIEHDVGEGYIQHGVLGSPSVYLQSLQPGPGGGHFLVWWFWHLCLEYSFRGQALYKGPKFFVIIWGWWLSKDAEFNVDLKNINLP